VRCWDTLLRVSMKRKLLLATAAYWSRTTMTLVGA
jgi:hypothetical protein